MIDYLQKFNDLPPKIKSRVSSPEKVEILHEIEKRYQIGLASVVIRIMIKEIDIRNLANYFVNNYHFDQARAQHLEKELKEKIFNDVINYLYRKDDLPVFSPDGIPLGKTTDDYFENKIDKILEGSQLKLVSEELTIRLRNILLTFLKNIRNKIATKDALTKSWENGGIGLDEQSADNLILLAEGELSAEEVKIVPPIKNSYAKPDLIFNRDIPYSFEKKQLEKKVQSEQKEIEEKISRKIKQDDVNISARGVVNRQRDKKQIDEGKKIVHEKIKEIAPPPPTIVKPQVENKDINSPINKDKQKTAKKSKNNIFIDQKKEVQTKEAKPIVNKKKEDEQVIKKKKIEPINNLAKTETGKIKMNDIKSTPRVFTPIDELRYMSLRNFRNLSSDPNQAIQKIKQKLQVLRTEDYGKMVAGIKAWKISPVNKMYLSVYTEGLNKGISVEDVLRSKRPDIFLTEDEFKAIIKLNKELKF